MKKMTQLALAAAGTMMLTSQAFAQSSGDATKIASFFSSAVSWLVTVMGPTVFVLGIVIVAFSMATGNEDSVRKGGYVVAGGALIFLSQSVVALLKQLAGV
jgi:type IV secretory pathway VirB2 component (pilin)